MPHKLPDLPYGHGLNDYPFKYTGASAAVQRDCVLNSGSILFPQLRKIERGEIIINRLRSPNLLNGTVFAEQQFRRTQLGVVLEAHRMTVRSRIMNHQDVTHLNIG